MNPNLELSIREAVAVKTGVLHFEIADRFDETTEVENARAIFFKLLLEYDIAYQAQLCVRYNLQINKLREYIDKASKIIYRECEKWIALINNPTYGDVTN